jgi:hypothetical protein
MAVSKDEKITPFQKALLEEYYANGFDSIKAYCKVKDIKAPKGRKERASIQAMVSMTRSGNPDYVAELEKKHQIRYGKTKDRLVAKLEGVADTFEELTSIALQDGELSEEDEAKFKRLKSIMTAKDYNKAVELIGKLTGSFEPEKVEVNNSFKVDWGTPTLQENNKPIIDITPEDDDE